MLELMKSVQSLEQLTVGTTLLDGRGISWLLLDGTPTPSGRFHKLLILDSQICDSWIRGEKYVCRLTVLNGSNGLMETRTVFGSGIGNYRIL